jgi:spoIIIJ-associated protein
MSIIEKEGKTVEQAIEKGLKEVGLSRDEVQVEIVSLGSPGFLGLLGGRPAKVRLKIQSQPRIKKIVETILEKMDCPGTVRSFSEEGSVLVATIDSPQAERMLKANNGAALDALEYLLSKIFHDAEQDIRLDMGGFRQSQGDSLKTLALELAKKVKESGQEEKMPPMPPQQRKIVHQTLEGNPDVKTFAVGEGDRRRVIIAPRQAGEPARPRPVRAPEPKPQPRPPRRAGQDGGRREARPEGSRPRPARQPERPRPRPETASPRPSPASTPRQSASFKPPEPAPRPEPVPAPRPSPAPRAESEDDGATGFVPRSKKKSRRR